VVTAEQRSLAQASGADVPLAVVPESLLEPQPATATATAATASAV